MKSAVPLDSSKAYAYEFGQLLSTAIKHRRPLEMVIDYETRRRTEVAVESDTRVRARCRGVVRTRAAVRVVHW